MAEYEAGLCNIGPKGRLQRAVFGALAVAFAIGVWGVFRLNVAPSAYLLLLFVPLFLGFVAIFEAALGFCVVYATRGVYDLR